MIYDTLALILLIHYNSLRVVSKPKKDCFVQKSILIGAQFIKLHKSASIINFTYNL